MHRMTPRDIVALGASIDLCVALQDTLQHPSFLALHKSLTDMSADLQSLATTIKSQCVEAARPFGEAAQDQKRPFVADMVQHGAGRAFAAVDAETLHLRIVSGFPQGYHVTHKCSLSRFPERSI